MSCFTLCLALGIVHAQELPDDTPPPAPSGSISTDEASAPGSDRETKVPLEGVAPGDPRHIIIPDPMKDTDAEAASGPRAARGAQRIVPSRRPTVPPRITRDTPRPVYGDAPVNVWGRYQVVEVTQAGITENYANKMERAGRALNDDCIVTRSVFDFGPLPEGDDVEGYRPDEVELVQIRECDVGGLGRYAEEVAMTLPARWTGAEGSTTLDLPEAAVFADFVRLSPPRDGDMSIPPQWLAPDSEVDRGTQSYVIIAEPARRGRLPVLHLTTSDRVLHLEADPGDSPFDQVDQAARR